MLYFSEIKGKKVFTEDEVYVGRLTDMIFLAQDHPRVTKIVLKTVHDPSLIVSINSLIKINNDVIITKNYSFSRLGQNELFLRKNLLDTQIIDIAGSKLVRVNDVVIAEKPEYHIAGVDIGILGILRWFGIERVGNKVLRVMGKSPTSQFLSWGEIQPLELGRGHVKIKKEQKQLDRIKPEDLADYLEKTNVLNVQKILSTLDERTSAEVLSQLNIAYQTALFKHFTAEKVARIVSIVDPEEAVDVLLTLPKKKREKVLDILSPQMREKIEYLLRLSKTPVGEILTTEYITVTPNMRVREILEKIKKETGDFHSLRYVYVVNKENQLIGVFNLHELLLKTPEIPAYKFMSQNLSVIYLTTPELAVFKKMVKYQLVALPVVDQEKHLLGVVNFDDIANLIADIND